ncbi:MAG: phage shock protein B [Alphaproteobacteria bacterium]|nr:phage shock protein B [Alphaproteobacteria bacterium]
MDIYSPFTMIVLIVLIAVGAGVIKTWLETRQNTGMDAETRTRLAELEQEVLRLRDRVKVLEKITTDDERNLREEFSRLA